MFDILDVGSMYLDRAVVCKNLMGGGLVDIATHLAHKDLKFIQHYRRLHVFSVLLG